MTPEQRAWTCGSTPRAAADRTGYTNTVFLRRLYIFLVIEHDRRRVHLAGITAHPAGDWVT